MTESMNRQSENRMLKVAAYIRVSTENAQQEDSYELQKSYFSRRLSSTPFWISAGIYEDYGISGTSRERRTGFARLLRHCEEGRIDHIITKSISRFARNTRDFLKALEILKANHVTIDFEKEHLNTAVAQNDLILTAFGALAQEESRSISANIQWGIRRHYSKGEARNIPIYGYRYTRSGPDRQITDSGYTFRRVEIVEKEAEIIRRIFTETAEGIPYVTIARRLNYDQIPAPASVFSRKNSRSRKTPDGRPGPDTDEGWTAAHISQIIRLERYTGDLLLQKTCKPDFNSRKIVRNKGERDQYYVQNHHPAIVSRELYQEVQTIRKINSSRCAAYGPKTIYPFSKLLVCRHCGRFYRTRNRPRRPIWYCASTILNNGRSICSAQKLYEEQLLAVCRKAVIDRFQLVMPPPAASPAGDPSTPHIDTLSISAQYSPALRFTLFETLIQKLENMQIMDNMERDRAYLVTQIAEIKAAAGSPTTAPAGQNICRKTSSLIEELTGRLDYLEAYWAALESTYDWRKKAISWMKSLPENQQGITDFLKGLTEKYTKAFILSIEIFSPGHYRFHWFDDTWSNIEYTPEQEVL